MQAITSIKTEASAAVAWLGSLPYAKLLYVVIIAFIICVLAREIYVVMFDKTVYIGRFEYFSDGKASEENAKGFPSYILGQYQLLRLALGEQRRQQEASSQQSNGFELRRQLPLTLPGLSAWTSSLADAEIKIQGFDIGKTLTFLRTWVAPPSEITGYVEKTSDGSRALMTWPTAAMTVDGDLGRSFDTGILTDDTSAAFAVAAGIAWSYAAAEDKKFRNIPRSVFVKWALAWWDYRALVGRLRVPPEFSDSDKRHWKQARALMEMLIPEAPRFAEIWRLRADIINVAPKEIGDKGVYAKQSDFDLDQKLATQDRLNYALNSTIPNFISVVSKILPTVPSGALQQALNLTAKTAVDLNSVRPGRTVWVRPVRPSSVAGQAADVSLTATAVVDQGGVKKLLLPDYAVLGNDSDVAFEIRVAPDGPVVAHAQRTDLVSLSDLPAKIGISVLLAPLSGTATSAPATAAKFTEVAAVPGPNTTVTLVTDTTRLEAKATGTEDGFIVVQPRITAPGLGGAPILDQNGHLVAMAYSATKSESRLLPLKALFDRLGLKLE